METYKTDSFGVAAYLMTEGAKIAEKEIIGKRMYVVLEGENLESKALGYFNGDRGKICKTFLDCYDRVKSYARGR